MVRSDIARGRRSTRAAWAGTAAAWLLVAAAVGCGRRTGPDVQEVSGVVLLEGSPFDGAHVAFHPVGGGIAAGGMTLADGSFRLTSNRGGRRNAGAVAGEYVVTVAKWRDDNPPMPPEPDSADPDILRKRREWEAAMAARKPLVSLVPKRYGDAATSDLKATVKVGRNTFRFDLRSN